MVSSKCLLLNVPFFRINRKDTLRYAAIRNQIVSGSLLLRIVRQNLRMRFEKF